MENRMKKRLISAAVGLALLAVVLFYFDGIFLNLVLSIVGQIALYEAVKAFCGKIRLGIFIPCSIYFVSYMFFNPSWLYTLMLLIFLLFCGMMMPKEKVKFRDASGVLAITMILTFGFTSVLAIRNLSANLADQRIMFAFALGFGWICDTFAFTFGKLFGKHKMSPNISPNKTIEGAVGGLLSTMVVSAGVYAIYTAFCSDTSIFFGKTELIHYLFFAAAGLVGAFVGLIGDLAFSYIKRECGLKDFGNIMPGHGGALDRVDSVLFTSVFASFVFVVYKLLFVLG